jgi:hypothetical protein
MTNLRHITEPSEIPKILELIHDCWLDASMIVLDSEKSTLSIRYLKGTGSTSSFVSRIRFPAIECFLRISRVESFSVQDKQKVRFYDINSLAYDPMSRCVQLRTGVPIEIRAIVADFDITVEETSTVVQR